MAGDDSWDRVEAGTAGAAGRVAPPTVDLPRLHIPQAYPSGPVRHQVTAPVRLTPLPPADTQTYRADVARP